MFRKIFTGIALGTCLAALQLAAPPLSAKELKVISETTTTGFGHVESVAYDPRGKVLYTGDFGPDLKPADKDGKGQISKVSLDGKILEARFLPAAGQTLNKPKGIWIKGNRLWVTDIDVVWVFDLKTKEGKKLELPGIQFANENYIQACSSERKLSSLNHPDAGCSRYRRGHPANSIHSPGAADSAAYRSVSRILRRPGAWHCKARPVESIHTPP